MYIDFSLSSSLTSVEMFAILSASFPSSSTSTNKSLFEFLSWRLRGWSKSTNFLNIWCSWCNVNFSWKHRTSPKLFPGGIDNICNVWLHYFFVTSLDRLSPEQNKYWWKNNRKNLLRWKYCRAQFQCIVSTIGKVTEYVFYTIIRLYSNNWSLCFFCFLFHQKIVLS